MDVARGLWALPLLVGCQQLLGIEEGQRRGEGGSAESTGGGAGDGGAGGSGGGSSLPFVRKDYDTGAKPASLAILDLTDDGFLDAAVANEGSSTTTYLRGTGTETLEVGVIVPTETAMNPLAIAAGDVGDGLNIDLAISGVQPAGTVRVLFNPPIFGPGPTGMAPAVAVAIYTPDNITYLAASEAALERTRYVPTPAFDPVDTNPLPNNTEAVERGLVVGRFASDGVAGLALAVRSDSTGSGIPAIVTYLGTTTLVMTPTPLLALPVAIAAGDLDDDGWDDLAVLTDDSHVQVATSNGGGSFDLEMPIDLAKPLGGVAIADFDGDGNLDVAVSAADEVLLLLGDGDGGLSLLSGTIPVGHGPGAIAAGDIDQDGPPDLVVVNRDDNTVSVLFNRLPLSQLSR